ncbi:MAG TPA: hypothetical protein VFK32_06425 [Tepidiformaceae bacterium]|nr:hypothetical protein [Tepidiformaceae bacterium]
MPRAVVIGGLVALGLVTFLGFRPHQPWILILAAAMTGLAVDGLVRSHPRWGETGSLASMPYLFLPVLVVLGSGLFIDSAIEGYSRPAAALGCAAVAGFVAWGEYQTVDFASRLYASVRLALAIITYLTAFAFYTVIFNENVDLPLAAFWVGLVSVLLSIELLRESHLAGPSSPLVGLAIGVSVAELRLGLYFFPLDGLLAGALLIIGFYLATGIVHHLLDHDLDVATAAEYAIVAIVGAGAVIVTRVFV